MFMMEGIKGKRVINPVLETHREVCFAARTLSRLTVLLELCHCGCDPEL